MSELSVILPVLVDEQTYLILRVYLPAMHLHKRNKHLPLSTTYISTAIPPQPYALSQACTVTAPYITLGIYISEF